MCKRDEKNDGTKIKLKRKSIVLNGNVCYKTVGSQNNSLSIEKL